MADPIENEEVVETPIEAPVEETPAEEGFGEDEISDLLDLSDEISEAEEVAPVEAASEEVEEEPSKTPDPAATEEEPKAEEVQDDPNAVKEEETPTPAPEEVEEEQPSREEVEAKWRDELQASYQLSEEDADLMLTEPETVVPKLASIIHQRVTTEVLQSVAQLMPQYLQGALQQQPEILTNTMTQAQAVQEAETKFFTSFPQLKEHTGKVAEVIKMVKQAPENASISQEDLINKAGRATMALLGMEVVAPQAQAETPAPAAKPFVPAQPGGSSGAVPQGDQQSEWDEIIATELI